MNIFKWGYLNDFVMNVKHIPQNILSSFIASGLGGNVQYAAERRRYSFWIAALSFNDSDPEAK